jgi:hypothetical protein
MSLEAVISSFASQISQLREAVLLRVDEGTKELYAQDLEAIEATVRALEGKLRDIKAYVKKEKDAIPKALAVVEAAKLQRRHLDHIAAHLPTYLPSLTTPGGPAASSSPPAPAVLQEQRSNGGAGEPEAVGPRKKAAATAAGPPAPVPRRYITQEEFDSVSPYMRGRLTPVKVNAALDELVSRADGAAALVTAARRNRPLGADRKHAQWLLYNLAPHEALRSRVWVPESDLKAGTALRLDNTGKTVLTLLRHLGRVGEVRIQADGGTHLVYVVL